ncbi:zinc-binding metallopeptidase family protein [Rhodococcoides yunnanense]|uniref:zinc-binding metallopeptidase family protein n=1 Tax=Rhodococcoides yunnanense TaxID=278209 RepID=UPI0009329EB8|nr:putative zinc-binding metallopeptidase [Rhodococcus yunnanensis]
MRDLICRKCGQKLSFENSLCLHCHSALGFHLPSRALLVLPDKADNGVAEAEVDGTIWRTCANLNTAKCNWLVDSTDDVELCVSCRLTRTRPADDDLDAMAAYADAETNKRRVILELTELGLAIVGRDEDPATGLAFDLLSSANTQVLTGHADGLITLDLAEGDDVHREQLRVSMAEPYRTLVGHFRHEIGHYYQMVLVGTGESRPGFEELFGDPDTDYQAALDRHYNEGAPENWEDDYVSSYATMHPAEDWAETFAHYLHIRDTLDTAAAFGMAPAGSTLDSPLPGDVGFDQIIEWWLPLSWALNQINRSMGHQDLYPFVLPPTVMDKMRFVHRLIAPSGL